MVYYHQEVSKETSNSSSGGETTKEGGEKEEGKGGDNKEQTGIVKKGMESETMRAGKEKEGKEHGTGNKEGRGKGKKREMKKVAGENEETLQMREERMFVEVFLLNHKKGDSAARLEPTAARGDRGRRRGGRREDDGRSGRGNGGLAGQEGEATPPTDQPESQDGSEEGDCGSKGNGDVGGVALETESVDERVQEEQMSEERMFVEVFLLNHKKGSGEGDCGSEGKGDISGVALETESVDERAQEEYLLSETENDDTIKDLTVGEALAVVAAEARYNLEYAMAALECAEVLCDSTSEQRVQTVDGLRWEQKLSHSEALTMRELCLTKVHDLSIAAAAADDDYAVALGLEELKVEVDDFEPNTALRVGGGTGQPRRKERDPPGVDASGELLVLADDAQRGFTQDGRPLGTDGQPMERTPKLNDFDLQRLRNDSVLLPAASLGRKSTAGNGPDTKSTAMGSLSLFARTPPHPQEEEKQKKKKGDRREAAERLRMKKGVAQQARLAQELDAATRELEQATANVKRSQEGQTAKVERERQEKVDNAEVRRQRRTAVPGVDMYSPEEREEIVLQRKQRKQFKKEVKSATVAAPPTTPREQTSAEATSTSPAPISQSRRLQFALRIRQMCERGMRRRSTQRRRRHH
jgi:hypothetical protein